MRWRSAVAVAGPALITLAVAAAGCSGSGDPTAEPVPDDPPQETMVVLGAGESDGTRLDDELRELWSRRVYQRLPPNWAQVGLAVSGATAAEALELQVPSALEVDPSLVTVWLVGPDAAAGTQLDAYRRDLTGIVDAFPAAEVVLMTAWRTPEAAREAPYSAVVREVAAATSSTLVDLADLPIADDDAESAVAQRVLDALRERPR